MNVKLVERTAWVETCDLEPGFDMHSLCHSTSAKYMLKEDVWEYIRVYCRDDPFYRGRFGYVIKSLPLNGTARVEFDGPETVIANIRLRHLIAW